MECEFSRWVINLSETTEQTGCRCGIDYSTITLFSENIPGGTCAFIGTENMNFEDELPVNIFHFLERNISKDASIIDKHVNTSEVINGCFNDFLSKLHWIVVGNSNTTLSFDLIDDNISCFVVISLSTVRSSQIVDDHLSSSTGKEESVLFTNTTSSSSHNHHFTIKS